MFAIRDWTASNAEMSLLFEDCWVSVLSKKVGDRDFDSVFYVVGIFYRICDRNVSNSFVMELIEICCHTLVRWEIFYKTIFDKIHIHCVNRIDIAVVIGPEGGIAEGEALMLQNAGAKVVTLGNRILRTETVALCVASIIMYEFEEK